MRALLFLLALAACAPAPKPEPAVSSSQSVPAPTPSDVAIRIGADKNGQVIQVPVGARFAVELVGVPTAGYVWTLAPPPAFLTKIDEASGPTSEAQRQPGFAGGNHWEVFVLEARAAGRGEVRLEQRRPWETNEPPNATFVVTIEAR